MLKSLVARQLRAGIVCAGVCLSVRLSAQSLAKTSFRKLMYLGKNLCRGNARCECKLVTFDL